MADSPIDDDRRRDYPEDMTTRVAVLETLSQQTLAVLQDLRAEARGARSESNTAIGNLGRQVTAAIDGLRGDFIGQVNGLRTEFDGKLGELRHEMEAGFAESRRVHDRDFRISIAVSLGIAMGLAGLIARAVHWM